MEAVIMSSIKIPVRIGKSPQFNGLDVPMANKTIENFSAWLHRLWLSVCGCERGFMSAAKSVRQNKCSVVVWISHNTHTNVKISHHTNTKKIRYQAMIMGIVLTTTNIKIDLKHRLHTVWNWVLESVTQMRQVIYMKRALVFTPGNSHSMGGKLAVEQRGDHFAISNGYCTFENRCVLSHKCNKCDECVSAWMSLMLSITMARFIQTKTHSPENIMIELMKVGHAPRSNGWTDNLSEICEFSTKWYISSE